VRQGQVTSSVSHVRLLPAFFASTLLFLAADRGPKADLSLKSIERQGVRLSDYRGKVVVLNFWATWCVPCTAELPMLVQAEKEYGRRGVVFIAASVDDRKSKKNVPDFLSKYHISFPVWLDATMEHLLKLGMGTAVPATAFLDQDGRIISRVQGQIHEEELKERVEWLLGARLQPSPPALVRHQ
jgi:thiol-disulfide isomerase/thioredoxin